jgi:hypothetical protein
MGLTSTFHIPHMPMADSGHCINLAPEWEKAASALKGLVTVAAVDGSVNQQLMQKYGIRVSAFVVYIYVCMLAIYCDGRLIDRPKECQKHTDSPHLYLSNTCTGRPHHQVLRRGQAQARGLQGKIDLNVYIYICVYVCTIEFRPFHPYIHTFTRTKTGGAFRQGPGGRGAEPGAGAGQQAAQGYVYSCPCRYIHIHTPRSNYHVHTPPTHQSTTGDSSSGSSPSSSSSRSSKSSSSGNSGDDSGKVVTLTDDNFKETVVGSKDLWLVAFIAPWWCVVKCMYVRVCDLERQRARVSIYVYIHASYTSHHHTWIYPKPKQHIRTYMHIAPSSHVKTKQNPPQKG